MANELNKIPNARYTSKKRESISNTIVGNHGIHYTQCFFQALFWGAFPPLPGENLKKSK